MVKFSILNRNFLINNDNDIEAICLFGSCAREDSDQFSDIDIFIIISDCTEEIFLTKKKVLSEQLGIPADWISMYRKDSIMTMHAYGSYFLWHLKTEGKLLYSRSGLLERLLETLPTYIKAREDLLDYLIICSDIRKSIDSGDESTFHYELAVLASLIRNTCITISYMYGKFAFGRIEPIEVCRKIIGNKFPFDLDNYSKLYQYRIAYIRSEQKLVLTQPTIQEITTWIIRAEFLIKFGLAKESELHDKNFK